MMVKRGRIQVVFILCKRHDVDGDNLNDSARLLDWYEVDCA